MSDFKLEDKDKKTLTNLLSKSKTTINNLRDELINLKLIDEEKASLILWTEKEKCLMEYKEVNDYIRHYSTVRSALSSFLLTVGISAFSFYHISKTIPKPSPLLYTGVLFMALAMLVSWVFSYRTERAQAYSTIVWKFLNGEGKSDAPPVGYKSFAVRTKFWEWPCNWSAIKLVCIWNWKQINSSKNPSSDEYITKFHLRTLLDPMTIFLIGAISLLLIFHLSTKGLTEDTETKKTNSEPNDQSILIIKKIDEVKETINKGFTPESPEDKPKISYKFVNTTSQGLNLRENPNINSTIIWSLRRKQKVAIIKPQKDWSLVKTLGDNPENLPLHGYVANKYLTNHLE